MPDPITTADEQWLCENRSTAPLTFRRRLEGPLQEAFLGSWERRSRAQEVEGRKATNMGQEDNVSKGGVSHMSKGWDGRGCIQNL